MVLAVLVGAAPGDVAALSSRWDNESVWMAFSSRICRRMFGRNHCLEDVLKIMALQLSNCCFQVLILSLQLFWAWSFWERSWASSTSLRWFSLPWVLFSSPSLSSFSGWRRESSGAIWAPSWHCFQAHVWCGEPTQFRSIELCSVVVQQFNHLFNRFTRSPPWNKNLGGFCQAAAFICARKSAEVSVGVLIFSSLLLGGLMSLALPMLPLVHANWQPVVAQPGTALLILLLLILISTLSIALPAAGSTRCPAAVSATVFTSSCVFLWWVRKVLIVFHPSFIHPTVLVVFCQTSERIQGMVSGYLSQVFVFHEVPNTLTIWGAASMPLGKLVRSQRRMRGWFLRVFQCPIWHSLHSHSFKVITPAPEWQQTTSS